MQRSPGIRRRLLQLAAVAFAAGMPALAQEPPPPPTPAPEHQIDVTGFVDVYYEYNFNRVDPAFRSFDVQHNTFSLSLAEVAFVKTVSPDSRVGFRADLDFGKTADLVAALEPAEDGKEVYKHVQQAYVSLLARDKLQLDFGKFVTPLGAEVIESQDNWNYSRSVLFGYAIPFYHLGLRAALPVNDKVSLNGYLVNGWNNSSEINGNKTWAFGATLKPSSKLTWVGTFMSGKETAGSDDDRILFDTTLTLALASRVTLMANYDYGKEGDVSWSGVAAYAKVQVRPHWTLAGRFEYLDDDDGGFMIIGQTAKTLTLTSDHLVAGALKVRLEYRADFTDRPFFTNDKGVLQESQSALLIGLVYAFGGHI
jgi:hypothetical protein